MTVSCLHVHLCMNSTAFYHDRGGGGSSPKMKFDLTQFEDKAPSTTCTVSVLWTGLVHLKSLQVLSK